MTNRVPSLRQLRGHLPDNVTILPTAANTQVQQPHNKAGRAARLELRENQRRLFPHKNPGVREAEKRAAAIVAVENEPGMIFSQAILAELDGATRLKVIERLAGSADYSQAHRQAFEVANTATLNFGQQWDLINALDRLRNGKGLA
jgi:hypothetical protein